MTRFADRIRVKRVYEPATADDGARVLVDRLWPRGLRREAAGLARRQGQSGDDPAYAVLAKMASFDGASWSCRYSRR